jgi:hypothetical protein
MLAAKVLGFLVGPAGRVFLLAGAFLSWGAYQRIDATQDCNEAHAKAELVEANRQLAIAQQIEATAREKADEAASRISQLVEQKDALVSEIKANGGSSCVIDPDTRERLLRIK